MNPNPLSRRLLRLLFLHCQACERIDLLGLCAESRTRPYAVLRALRQLEAAGLVDARRLRLTLQGLAVACALVQPSARPELAAEPEPRQPGLARCLPESRAA